VDWYYFAMVVYFYSGHWWIFTPALTNQISRVESRNMHMLATIILTLGVFTTTAMAENISGKPRIIDGDTIAFGKTRIRLFGIDVPVTKQTCSLDGKPWPCGQDATIALSAAIGEPQRHLYSERQRSLRADSSGMSRR